MEKVTIRQMKLSDICDVVEIEKECFTLPWSYKSFEESLSKSYAVFLVAEVSGEDSDEYKIVGYVGAYHMGDECDITNVAVSSVYRRRGIAGLLLKGIEEYGLTHDVHTITLEVRESNIKAISLYEKMQYKNIGIRKKFYEKPIENAIIMVREF